MDDLLARISALIPLPRLHMVRYHGVLSARPSVGGLRTRAARPSADSCARSGPADLQPSRGRGEPAPGFSPKRSALRRRSLDCDRVALSDHRWSGRAAAALDQQRHADGQGGETLAGVKLVPPGFSWAQRCVSSNSRGRGTLPLVMKRSVAKGGWLLPLGIGILSCTAASPSPTVEARPSARPVAACVDLVTCEAACSAADVKSCLAAADAMAVSPLEADARRLASVLDRACTGGNKHIGLLPGCGWRPACSAMSTMLASSPLERSPSTSRAGGRDASTCQAPWLPREWPTRRAASGERAQPPE